MKIGDLVTDDFYEDVDYTEEYDDGANNHRVNDFWAGAPGQAPAQSEAREAAEVLGFQAVPTDFPTVKQRFRRAVMHAHPDRGGKTETIQHLNQAFAVLKAHFRHSI